MQVSIGKTYTVRDGAGYTAFRCDGEMSGGYLYGVRAVDTDGEDILTHEEASVPLSDIIEPIEGVNWETSKNLSALKAIPYAR